MIELIVVIAIMAVMVAVLAPALLQYVEKSRAQKDNSTMSEVVNAVTLALSDQNVYDEMLKYTTPGNVSCYIDSNTEAAYKSTDSYKLTKSAVDTSDKDQYMYDDSSRVEDEVKYYFAGNMRGVTITFEADGTKSYTISEGVLNKAISDNNQRITTDREASATTSNKSTILGAVSARNYMYNQLRASVGDVVTLSSQTYRNSDYTIFIRMGTTGGHEASQQDAIAVYGQWNGTNLYFEDTGNSNNNVIPIPDINFNWLSLKEATDKLNPGKNYEPVMTIWEKYGKSMKDGAIIISHGVAYKISDAGDYKYNVVDSDGKIVQTINKLKTQTEYNDKTSAVESSYRFQVSGDGPIKSTTTYYDTDISYDIDNNSFNFGDFILVGPQP